MRPAQFWNLNCSYFLGVVASLAHTIPRYRILLGFALQFILMHILIIFVAKICLFEDQFYDMMKRLGGWKNSVISKSESHPSLFHFSHWISHWNFHCISHWILQWIYHWILQWIFHWISQSDVCQPGRRRLSANIGTSTSPSFTFLT